MIFPPFEIEIEFQFHILAYFAKNVKYKIQKISIIFWKKQKIVSKKIIIT